MRHVAEDVAGAGAPWKGDRIMARRKDRTRQAIKPIVNATASTEALLKTPSGTLPFRTATYARLSVDSAVTASDSITSQQMLMRDYMKGRDEFFLVREYKDDGISGTRFDRQAFESLLGEVRKGNINCIIVKDFSRFGRDHIEVGNYLEKIFPFLGVRFISVNDGYDSLDKSCADKKLAVILKNLVNEYIAKDTSVKVASGYATKQENGEYDGGRAPYGYAFADERKTRFLIDERPAGIIRDIFTWAMQGDSTLAMVKRLTERNINPPKAYQDTGAFYRQEKERCYWNEYTVKTILQNMAYAGHMALHKWKESKADGTGLYKLEEAEWKITRNAHEAIVSEHDFNLVQEMLRARTERHKSLHAMDENIFRPENLLKGKVFCGDCLVPMSRMGANYQRKNGKIRIYRYRCRTYREKGARECSPKSIAEKDLEDIVYRAVMALICQVECLDDLIARFHNGFFQKLQKGIEREKSVVERAIRQEKNEKMLLYQEYKYSSRNSGSRHGSIGQACKDGVPGSHKDGASGSHKDGVPGSHKDEISDSHKEWYLQEKQKKDREIRCYEERKAQLEEKSAFLARLEKEQAGWIKEILKDIALEEKGLTAEMASIFVDKILLYDGKRVEIVLNFTGECESLYAHMGQIWRMDERRDQNE